MRFVEARKVRSNWWYLLPILLNVIGGVIAYFILRDDDPRKAKNCLLLGVILTAISVGFSLLMPPQMPNVANMPEIEINV